MQETKYGIVPTNELLKDGRKFGFERMCIVHDSIIAMVHFFSIYIDVYYLILKFSIFSQMYIHSLQFLFYVCRWKVKKKKTINTVNKTFVQINQVMEVGQALTIVPTKNDDIFGYQCNYLYFLK